MTPVERVERMLAMEAVRPEKDDAGIFNANAVDAAVKRKTLQEVIDKLKEDYEGPETD